MAKATPVEAIDHFPNGNVRYRGFKLGEEFHGEWAFYRADGSLLRSGSFDRGRQIGLWRTYGRDGTMLKATDFGK